LGSMPCSVFRCGGKAPVESDESPLQSCSMTRPSKRSGGRRTTMAKYVDSSTSVPIDLYMSLMRAGEQARNSGQHYLIKDEDPKYMLPGSRKPTGKPQPRLVNSDSDASSAESPIRLLIPTAVSNLPMKLDLGAASTDARDLHTGLPDMQSSVYGA